MKTPERFVQFSLSSSTPSALDPILYSKLKHGSSHAARKFGRDLADAFAASEIGNAIFCPNRRCIKIASSAYISLPTAAASLAQHFAQRLNEHLHTRGLNKCDMIRLVRTTPTDGDYATMSEAARKKQLDCSGIAVAPEHVDSLDDATLIVVDDIRVTGSHEACILKALDGLNCVTHVCLAYLAAFADNSIDPSLESVLNKASIKSLDDLAELIEGEQNLELDEEYQDGSGYMLNSRVCKDVVAACKSDIDVVRRFITRVGAKNIGKELIEGAKRDGLHVMKGYAQPFEVLESLVEEIAKIEEQKEKEQRPSRSIFGQFRPLSQSPSSPASSLFSSSSSSSISSSSSTPPTFHFYPFSAPSSPTFKPRRGGFSCVDTFGLSSSPIPFTPSSPMAMSASSPIPSAATRSPRSAARTSPTRGRRGSVRCLSLGPASPIAVMSPLIQQSSLKASSISSLLLENNQLKKKGVMDQISSLFLLDSESMEGVIPSSPKLQPSSRPSVF